MRFGLPAEFQPLEEGETRFKEQIYNWFKNTIGRKRRQAEGKPRSVKSANSAGNSSKAKADRSVASSSTMPSTAGPSGSGSTNLSPTLQWNPIPQQQTQPQLSSSTAQTSSLAAFAGHNPGPHVAESSSSSPALGTIQQPQAISLGQIHFGLHTPQQTPQHVHSHTPPVPQPTGGNPSSHSTHHQQQQQHQHQQQQHQHQHSTHSSHSSHHSPHEQQHTNSIHPLPAPTPIRVASQQQQQQQQTLPQHTHVNQETLRDALISPSVEISTLASMIQIFVSSCPPSLTPLTLVVEVLFGASISSGPSSSYANGGSSRTMDDLSPLYPNGSSSSKTADPGGYGNISLKGPNAPHPLAHSYSPVAHRGDGNGQNGYSRDPTPLVQRFCEASQYWGTSIVHCNLTGVEAAGRALMGLVRRWSVWQPQPSSLSSPPTTSSTPGGFNPANTGSSSLGMVGLGLQAGGSSLHGGLGGMSGYGGKMASPSPAHAGVASSSGGSSLTEEMQRITAERQRRKDHIQWARIHAAALEVGLVGAPASSSSLQIPGGGTGTDSTQSYGRYISERAFSEMVARDAVWEEDEAEWVAGLYVLRGLIRSAVRGNKPFGPGVERRQREEYREMLRVYEGRWKEIKDEVRQSLATEALFSAKEELDSMAP